MGISRNATAHWEGDLKTGKGKLSTPQSGLLADTRYGFNSRFGTRAEVDLSMEGGPTLSHIRLKMKAVIPGIDESKFRAIADDAKQNCPVSKALSAVPISLEAELAG